LRKRKVTDDQLEKRAQMRKQALIQKKKNLKNPDLLETVKRPEKFIMEYREKQRNYVQQKKRGHQLTGDDINGKVIIAVRIKGDKNLTDRQKFLLKRYLKLKKQHEVAIIKVNEEIEKIFKICEPFIAYGYVEV